MHSKNQRGRVVAIVVAMLVGSAMSACLGGATSPGTGASSLLVGPDDDDGACAPSERCARFCAEAGELGCPQEGDCVEMCEAQFERSDGCERELEELLACAPPHLAPPANREQYFMYPTCGLTPFHTRLHVDPEAEPPPSVDCEREADAFDACIFDRAPPLQQYDDRCHVTSPFLVRTVGAARTSAGDAPNAIETAYLKCSEPGRPDVEHELKAWCNVEGWCGCYVDHEEIASCDILLHGRGMVLAPASCCAPYFDEVLGL
jgi:hypothetical protein